MNTHNAVVIVHIDETLSDDEIHEVEQELATDDGVQAACMHVRTRHLMVVDYDAEQIKSLQLLGRVRSQGLHAALIGGI
ncbi:MAG: heavy-metal-associated domain-containing protein [Pseudomonadota bacterium]